MRESKSSVVVQAASPLSFLLGERTREIDERISVIQMATGTVYRDIQWDTKPLLRAEKDPIKAQDETAIVYHSSGSTGLPKSIATSHAKLLSPIPTGKGTKALTSSPLCHAFASKLTINSMMVGKCMYLASASIPSTADTLVEVFRATSPDVFLTVPYVLKLLAETAAGVRALSQCKQVVSSGSTLSDELGNRLVAEGVNVETLFAGTEPGLVGTSMNRPPGDLAWDYIRLPPTIQKNTQYKPLGGDVFEFVYLNTLPTLNMSNSNDPPGSFHSSDIFSPHPTIPHAWKYVGRIDDRVTLSTGEKVLPLPMEGRVREEPSVREAVVFGVDKAIPGLLVFRSDAAKDVPDDDFITQIWPSVEAANAASEAFGRIAKEMIVCMPAEASIPLADKESIIRAKVYTTYDPEIQAAYARLEEGSPDGVVLDLPELEEFLIKSIQTEIGIPLTDSTTDFHQAGMDSLLAIRLRALILKHIKVDRQLSQNVVFDTGNVQRLAQRILGTGAHESEDRSEKEATSLMQELIEKYSRFSPRAISQSPLGMNVLLTGPTGSLGAHLLANLLALPDVTRVYCIVRGEKPPDRVRKSLQSRSLSVDHIAEKAIIFSGDLSLPNLGIEATALDDIKQHVTHIIHAAWPVNFQLTLRAFEPQLRSLQNLVDLSLSKNVGSRPRLLFCSSISVAMATPTPANVPEMPVSNLAYASSTGYARSKLVGERMIEVAAKEYGGDAKVLRIGQVVGDTKAGIWNASEAWPLIIRSALTLKTMPAFRMVGLISIACRP